MDISTQKMLAETLLGTNKRSVSPYSTTGKVKSISNDTIYIEMSGSDINTPVKVSNVSVKVGDIVDVIVSHEDTRITGNRTDVAVSSSTTEKMSKAFEQSNIEILNKLDIVGNNIVAINNEIELMNSKINIKDSEIEVIGSELISIGSNVSILNSAFTIEDGVLTGLSKIIVDELDTSYAKISTLESDYATIKKLEAEYAKISTLESDYATISKLESEYAKITTLESDYATISKLESEYAKISTLESDYAKISTLESDYAKISTLESDYAKISTLESDYATIAKLESDYATIAKLESEYATIKKLEAEYATITTLESDYATIDLLNVDVAWIENGLIKEGAIGTSEIADASITTAKISELSADVIKAGTLSAERLILTTDEVDPETGEKKKALITALNAAAETSENGLLDGAIVSDNTITAAKIDVVDLNAFEATIGNFVIGTSSIYNQKNSLKDPTNGVYIGTDGIALGQGSLLDVDDDSLFRVESDGDFHLGGNTNNYINFDPFTRELNINAKSIKMESRNIIDIAQSEAKTAVYSIRIGGKNLIHNSETLASEDHELYEGILTYNSDSLTYKGEHLTM